jgi:hypothetical protein
MDITSRGETTCPRAEEPLRRGPVAARAGSPRGRTDLEHPGFSVRVNDLEDGLIRAMGMAGVKALFDAQGDLGSFGPVRNQPAWRGREPHAQTWRFLGSGSRRRLRYARDTRRSRSCPGYLALAARRTAYRRLIRRR